MTRYCPIRFMGTKNGKISCSTLHFFLISSLEFTRQVSGGAKKSCCLSVAVVYTFCAPNYFFYYFALPRLSILCNLQQAKRSSSWFTLRTKKMLPGSHLRVLLISQFSEPNLLRYQLGIISEIQYKTDLNVTIVSHIICIRI